MSKCECNVCRGISHETPNQIENASGRSEISYRVGTQSRFKESLLASLSLSDSPAVAAFATRDDLDPTISLLDATASMLDVITFYNERIATECLLRSATESLSINEMAALVGYVPSPGASAEAHLAFDFESAIGAPVSNPVPVGTKVQSVPGVGEKPQLFETKEPFVGHSAWNDIPVRATQPQVIAGAVTTLVLQGLPIVRMGDVVMYRATAGTLYCAMVSGVKPDDSSSTTTITIDGHIAVTNNSADAQVLAPPPVLPVGSVAASYGEVTVLDQALIKKAADSGWTVESLFKNLSATKTGPGTIAIFRARAGIFGNSVKPWAQLPLLLNFGQYIQKPGTTQIEWKSGAYASSQNAWVDAFTLSGTNGIIGLDSIYPNVAHGSFTILENGTSACLYKVSRADEKVKEAYDLTLKVTEVTLNSVSGLSTFSKFRETRIHGAPEFYKLAETPVPTNVSGNIVELEGYYSGFTKGQSLIIHGESATDMGVQVLERCEIDFVDHQLRRGGYTVIHLATALKNQYRRRGTKIKGNVVHANRGESAHEVLGSGDARRAFQRFALKQGPVSYELIGGAIRSTIRVFVNDIEWKEVPSLYGIGPSERVFQIIRNGKGQTIIQFGDGKRGSRLPSGAENVKATYRVGTGNAANVPAGKLTTALGPPIGFRQVTNPLPAIDGADPEDLVSSRMNAPVNVRTLGRVVSLKDYQYLATTIPGVAKAHAAPAWLAGHRGVLVSVALQNGAALDPLGNLFKNLTTAYKNFGDPNVAVWLRTFQDKRFEVRAKVKADPAYQIDLVKADVVSAVETHFAFAARTFGQHVTLSETIALIQSVPGVIMVDLDTLRRTDRPLDPPLPQVGLPSALSIQGDLGAELMTVDKGAITIEVTQ